MKKVQENGEKYKKYSDEWFVDLYLKYGSVEETLAKYPDSLPISAANYHRLILKKGIITSAGRHVSLPETLHFFRLKAMQPGAPLEKIYKSMSPSFQTSISTLHRVYQFVEKEAVRRYAAALVVTKNREDNEILIANELSENSRYDKKVGDITIPMSFAKKDEPEQDSVLRVLQHEVFTGKAINGELDKNLVKHSLKPFMFLQIVDVRVAVFKLDLPRNSSKDFESYKLTNHKFMNIYELMDLKESKRAGIDEILNTYLNIKTERSFAVSPVEQIASINEELFAFANAS